MKAEFLDMLGRLFAMDIFTAEAIIKLALACFLGGIIGWQRERTHHPAGFRTHILVSLGSAAFMLLGLALLREYGGNTRFDPGRVLQGIATGVGFIGAGTIMREGPTVHGLTTAASLWVASALGTIVAAGECVLAVVLALVSLVVLFLAPRSASTQGNSTG